MKRVLLKLSGELLGNANGKGLSLASIKKIAEHISRIKTKKEIQLAIVVGGGNILRGKEFSGTDFNGAVADSMGMIGTVINGLALQEALEKTGTPARLMTSIRMEPSAEFYIRKKAIAYLESGNVVIFSGGTGNPFFTTDSAAVLRACETDCSLILKATHVDGIYDRDPKKHGKKAKLYKEITYKEALAKDLRIMDSTAFALAWREGKQIIVFNEKNLSAIPDILEGKKIGTLVK
ncbi:MAG: UMP kinase [Candidatus Pacebacteria bacterium]|nr:UMP kinase [Candidatus Paceibacterota bacterium]